MHLFPVVPLRRGLNRPVQGVPKPAGRICLAEVHCHASRVLVAGTQTSRLSVERRAVLLEPEVAFVLRLLPIVRTVLKKLKNKRRRD